MKKAKKADKVNTKKNVENNDFKESMRTDIKNVENVTHGKDKEKATANLKVAIKRIDKATAKGVSTKNTSARNKSRLTKKVNEME